jgi:hypothetical protein
MPLRNNTRTLHAIEQAPHVRQANVGSTASATAAIIVGAVRRLACALQMQRRPCGAFHDVPTRARFAAEWHSTGSEAAFVRRGRHHATMSFWADQSTAPRNGDVDRHSHHSEGFRADDVLTGRRYHPTVDGKIKAAACGAVGWRKSADKSGTSDSVRQDRTACGFAQVAGKSILYARCVRPRHDQRR